MVGSYDPWLVALSIIVAVIASFVALDLAPRVASSRGSKASWYWLAGSAISLGVGVWSTHFIAMLAFLLPIPISYDISLTFCSLLVALLGSGFALYTVSSGGLSLGRLTLAGVWMGTGIAAMHYLGMEAMHMQPRIAFNPWYVTLSISIPIVVSAFAMWIAFQPRPQTSVLAFGKKFGGALTMGAAIAGMHYTGMAAANFAEGSICVATAQAFDNTWLAGTVGAFTVVTILMISAFVTMRPTIRSRLVFLAVGCLVPVSLMAISFVVYDYRRTQAELVGNSVGRARVIASLVDKDLATVESGLLVLATSPLLVANNYSAFYSQAKDALRELHANAITLSDATGQQLIDTRRPYGEALPLYDNPAQARRIFETAQPAMSDLFVGSLDHELLITIGAPVRRGDEIVHQVSASISSDRLSRILAQQNLPPDWIVAIYDSSGTIVARTHEMARFVGKKGAPAVLKRLTEVEEGSVETKTLEGIPVISAFSRSAASKWTVAIGMPTKNFTRALWNSLWWLLFAIAVLLAGSLALAWFIGGAIARSVHALTEPALALGTGVKVTVPPLGLIEADEVGKALTKASTILVQAQYDAQHDVLTGLANRGLFGEIVKHELMVCKRAHTSLAVLFIDLDGFKAVNDMHGHEMGDALLRAVAARLQVSIRESDLAARLGGDEFAIVLIQPGRDGAAAVAGKLVESLSVPFPIGALRLEISASIGVAIYPDSATTIEALLRCADEAMYKAKKAGKRRFVVAAR